MAGLAAADDLCPLDGDRRVFGAVCCRADPANTWKILVLLALIPTIGLLYPGKDKNGSGWPWLF